MARHTLSNVHAEAFAKTPPDLTSKQKELLRRTEKSPAQPVGCGWAL
jgi:hypothetical protein